MKPFDPYRASATPGKAEADEERGPSPWLMVSWLVVFAINLPIPLWFGWSFAEGDGRAGVIAALPLIFAIGIFGCGVARKVGLALVVGGVIVALSQFFPVLQIVAGVFGIAVGRVLGLVEDGGGDVLDSTIPSLAGGFVVTLATAAALIGPAVVMGSLLSLFLPRRWRGDPAGDV